MNKKPSSTQRLPMEQFIENPDNLQQDHNSQESQCNSDASNSSNQQDQDQDINSKSKDAKSKPPKDTTKQKKQQKKVRGDNSLAILTTKFVEMIKKAPNETVDLNDTVKVLSVQKRRIYDITNVLEGIGYVQKVGKNRIRWIGSCLDPEIERQIIECKIELDSLTRYESRLDEYIELMGQRINEEIPEGEDADKESNKYITFHDLEKFADILHKEKEEMIVIIKSAKKDNLQTEQLEEENKITFRTVEDKIDVYLCKAGESVTKISDEEEYDVKIEGTGMGKDQIKMEVEEVQLRDREEQREGQEQANTKKGG